MHVGIGYCWTPLGRTIYNAQRRFGSNLAADGLPRPPQRSCAVPHRTRRRYYVGVLSKGNRHKYGILLFIRRSGDLLRSLPKKLSLPSAQSPTSLLATYSICRIRTTPKNEAVAACFVFEVTILQKGVLFVLESGRHSAHG
jgi:hypothetical protein